MSSVDEEETKRLEADFKYFSTDHSWYKHIPMPTKFFLVPYYDDQKALHWNMWYYSEFKRNQKRLEAYGKHLCAILESNLVEVNALVYSDEHGFHLTIQDGGDEWLKWLESVYPEEHAFISKERQYIDWDASDVIKNLRKKEYDRIFIAFVAATVNVRKQCLELGIDLSKGFSKVT